MNTVKIIKDKFKSRFNETPILVRSPGRINLIGEHTDYNEGFVLPAAVDKEIVVALTPRTDRKCIVVAHDLGEEFEFDLEHLEKSRKGWPNYIMGVVQQFLMRHYPIMGFKCVFGGYIPIGAGLSSSAALECGVAVALDHAFSLDIQKIDIVKMCQMAENQFVGVKCGIMDQFSNMFGKKDNVFKLDCRSLQHEYYPFKLADMSIILLDTQVKHSLASSEYNTRREQCESGVKILQKHDPKIQSLRDVSLDLLQSHKQEFEEVIFSRCEYVIEENLRVLVACQDLKAGNFYSFGNKMYGSHEGLRDKYEVSIKELDVLVEIASKDDAVLGARMMGGGFGGCTINLVNDNGIDDFLGQVKVEYKSRTGREVQVYKAKIADGTAIVEI